MKFAVLNLPCSCGSLHSPEYGPVKLVDHLLRQQQIPGWKIVEEVHSLVVVERPK